MSPGTKPGLRAARSMNIAPSQEFMSSPVGSRQPPKPLEFQDYA